MSVHNLSVDKATNGYIYTLTHDDGRVQVYLNETDAFPGVNSLLDLMIDELPPLPPTPPVAARPVVAPVRKKSIMEQTDV